MTWCKIKRRSRPGLWVAAVLFFAVARGLSNEPVAHTASPAVATTNEAAVASLADTNQAADYSPPTKLDQFKFTLATARFQASTREFGPAEQNFVKLLARDVPEEIQQTALFELALAVQAQDELPRAQSIFSQYLQRWPMDLRVPEIYLHQGRIFRQMGLNNFALSKFYGVMTMALSLKNDQLPNYQRLVLQAQVEIAETQYLAGKFADAADYYSRLLVQNNPALDRPQIQFRLVRSLTALNRHADAITQAQDFLTRYQDSPEEPEVRYHLAQALKGQGRSGEALRQVMIFLKEQRTKTKSRPDVWAYWQERVGNEIGNQLYTDGDYMKALEVYQLLADLNPSPAWQIPARYQVAMTYEKLLQPVQAQAVYRAITNAVPDLGTNMTPSLQTVVEMAGWRLRHLEWQSRAAAFTREPFSAPATNVNPNLSQQ